MHYTYTYRRTGPREWSVIETDPKSNEVRTVARCDDPVDASIIAKLYSRLESGDISTSWRKRLAGPPPMEEEAPMEEARQTANPDSKTGLPATPNNTERNIE